MATSLASRFARIAVGTLIALVLVGCSAKLQERYQSPNGMVSLQFKSGNALLTTYRGTVSAKYEVKGKQVTLQNGLRKLVLTRNSDGSLEGPLGMGKLFPVSASAEPFQSSQSSDMAPAAAAAGGLLALTGAALLFFVVIGFGIYAYIAFSLVTIAKKTGTPNAWMGWIPIANLVLMLHVAQKPVWWLLLMLIPLVNIVIFILVWMQIAKARHRPDWWGVLIIAPLVNVALPGVLAFTDPA